MDLHRCHRIEISRIEQAHFEGLVTQKSKLERILKRFYELYW